MNKYAKTAMIALIIVSAAMMSGCLDGTDIAKETITVDDMTQLEAILTNPKYSDEEKATAFAKVSGIEVEVNDASIPTPTPEMKRKIVGVTVSQGSADIIAGIGEVLVTIQGGEDYDTLTEIEVFANNISLGTYPPEYQTEYKIECNIVGNWNIRIDGTFTDGTVQTLINTSGFELLELKDVPNASALGERYIETDDRAMTREEAKALCDELGIVWGDERDS